jgi:transposase InsO family protein
LTTTNYFTNSHEEITLKEDNTEQLIFFFQENVLSRFGVPKKLITHNGSMFISSMFTNFCGNFGIIMGQSSNYYPQGNGLNESTNKSLIQIIKKTIAAN